MRHRRDEGSCGGCRVGGVGGGDRRIVVGVVIGGVNAR